MGYCSFAAAWKVGLAVVVGAFVSSTSAQSVSLPNCSAVAPNQTVLANVQTSYLSVPNSPFGLVYASSGDVAFVSLASSRLGNSSIGVLNTSTPTPSLMYQIPLPANLINSSNPYGLALTPDQRYLFASVGEGAIVVDVARAINGSSDAVVGTLNGTTATQNAGSGAIEVTFSKNGSYAFISQEYGANPGKTTGNIDVFKLHRSTTNDSVSGTPVGFVNLGYAVVGTALSHDNRTLYAVSETTTRNDSTPGILSVLNVTTLKTDPSQALLSNVSAGCGPVRILVSKGGSVVWVTARESNHLLAFNASMLISDPDNALLASVQVGTAPVGLTFVRNGTRILTADSNRFRYKNATSGISVVDVHAALHGGGPAVLGRVPTGLFPREFAVSPDGNTVLVADYTSFQIQSINVTSLP